MPIPLGTGFSLAIGAARIRVGQGPAGVDHIRRQIETAGGAEGRAAAIFPRFPLRSAGHRGAGDQVHQGPAREVTARDFLPWPVAGLAVLRRVDPTQVKALAVD